MNIAVIGLGKLGLPLAALLASNGNSVKGYDISESVRTSLRNKEFNSNEPGLRALLDSVNLSFTIVDDMRSAVKDVEILFVIVPTPSDFTGHFSNKYLLDSIDEIAKSLDKDKRFVINIVSTVMPGSCEKFIKPRLELGIGKSIGSDIGLCYNPEFIALGSVIKDMQFPDMHLIGQSSDWAGEVVLRALNTIIKKEVPVRRMNLREAELVKLAINNYVTMKISFANMLMQGSALLGGVDVDVVTNAIGLDTRIGHKYLKAAAPYGGPCFPRDTRALSAFYNDLGLTNSLSKASEEVNKSHTIFIAEIIQSRVNSGARVGIAGLSYKSGTNVIEDSPGLSIAMELASRGFEILIWDDEGATIQDNHHFSKYRILDNDNEFISLTEFILISRPLNNPIRFKNLLIESKKPFLDLWREI